MSLFSKNKDKQEKKDKKAEVQAEVQHESVSPIIKTLPYSSAILGFHISEKASRLMGGVNQYIFKVSGNANKSEIAKQVGKLFNVKVRDVKILNMPDKVKNIGRREGIKSGYKKAIVTLVKGDTIAQAQP